MRKKVMRILSLCMVASMTLTPIQSVYAAEMTSVIKINEVESNEPTTDIDWVEIINTGTEAVDLSNWFITDNKVILYDNNNQQQDSFSYSGHAVGTYSRVPDGTGEFIDQAATKGTLNIVEEEENQNINLSLMK